MRFILPMAALLLSACMAPSPVVTTPQDLSAYNDGDRGTIAGTWRARGDQGFTLSVMQFRDDLLTFAASRDCTMRGGTLTPSAGAFSIGPYSNFSDDRCGSRTSGPAIAPFDGDRVSLSRNGMTLTVSGSDKTVVFERDRLADLSLKPELIYGTWLLSDGTSARSGPDRTSISFAPGKVSFTANCKSVETNGFALLPGLIINPGGDMDIEKTVDCDVGTGGDVLVESRGRVKFRYLPDSDRIEARLDARRYLFIRAR